jgi:outer membrane protein assembly factor BamB
MTQVTLSIPETLLLELLQAHRYLGETGEEERRAALFGDFLQQRWRGIFAAHVAIQQGIISENDLQSSLLFQRAIFLLKNKVVPLDEIWLRQNKWEASACDSIESQVRQLPPLQAEEIGQQVSAYLLAEDLQDREWREQCRQGIVGIKYVSPALTPPPSNITTPPPSKLLLDYEIDATESLQRPNTVMGGSSKQRSPFKYIAIGGVLVVVVLVVFAFLGPGADGKLLQQIEYALADNNYIEAQAKCRDFRSRYAQSKHLPEVNQYLQKALLRQAGNGQRQGNWQEADKVLCELEQMELEGETARQAREMHQEVQQAMARAQKQERFAALQKEIAENIRQGNFHGARVALATIKNDVRELQSEQIVAKFLQELEQKEKDQKLSYYRFYSAAELAKAETAPVNSLPPGISVSLLPLIGKKQLAEFSDVAGNFFVTIAGYLYAIKAASGQIVWTEYVGNASSSLFIAGWREHFNMERVDKVLVAAFANNTLRLLQAEDGTKIWETAVPGLITTTPVLYKDKVYVGTLDHHCYQVALSDGNLEGAYRTGGAVDKAPVFDRRSDTLYLCAREQIHAYTLTSGKLSFILSSPGEIAQAPLAISPYLCLFTAQNGKTGIHFYYIGKKAQPEAIQTFAMPGVMRTPATLAGGMVALATDTHQAIFGINPANPREAMFPLQKPTSLTGKGPAYLRFGNFLRQLMVAQEQFALYRPSGFADKENTLNKIAEWKNGDEWPGGESEPLQQCGNFFLWSQQDASLYNFQATCLHIVKDNIGLVWRQQLAPAVLAAPLLTPDRRLLFTTHDGSIHELYSDSRQEFCYRILANVAGNGRVAPLWLDKSEGELVVVGKELQILDAVTGLDKTWKAEVSLKGKPAQVTRDNKLLFVVTGDGVSALSLESGKKVLEYSEFRGEPFCGIPLYQGNSLWIGRDNGQLYQFQWTPGNPYLQKVFSFQTEGAIRAMPLGAGEILYFASRDNCLYALHSKTHQLLWKFAAEGPLETTPLLANGTLYFGADDRQLYAVEAQTGKLRWQSKFYGKLRATPLLHNDKLYLASIAGDLHAYAVPDGRQLWKISLGGSIFTSPVAFAGRIFLAGSNGFVYCVEEKN